MFSPLPLPAVVRSVFFLLEATGYTTRVLRGGWDVIFQVAAGLGTLNAGSDKGPRLASRILLALGLARIRTGDIETSVVRAKKIRIDLHWRKDSVRNGRRGRRLLRPSLHCGVN